MPQLSQVLHRRHSLINFSTPPLVEGSCLTMGLRNRIPSDLGSKLFVQRSPEIHKPDAIFNNPKGAKLSRRLQGLFSKYLLVSFKGQRLASGDIARPTHGVMHAVRTALWVPLLLSCYPDEKLSSAEIEALMIAASLHDSGRDGDFADSEEWEKKSAFNCEQELKSFGFDEDIINKCTNAILNKESGTSLFAKILHDCDVLEVIRVKTFFSPCQLHIRKIEHPILFSIIQMIESVISMQGDLQCDSYAVSTSEGLYSHKISPRNYDVIKKCYFEFAENALATQLLWFSHYHNPLYQKIIGEYDCLAVDENYKLSNDFSSEHLIKTKVISPLLRLHIDEPTTVKRTGVFSHNTKLNDFMSLSVDVIFDDLEHLADNELQNYLNELINSTVLSTFVEIKLQSLIMEIIKSVTALKTLFENIDDNIDKVLVFMDLVETHTKINKLKSNLSTKSVTYLSRILDNPIMYPLIQFCKIAQVATNLDDQYSTATWYDSYFSESSPLIKRNYTLKAPSESTNDNQWVVDVDRLDQPPFTKNRNMRSRYGFHQLEVIERDNCALKSSVSAHPLSEFSSEGWDQKLYHGTQSDSFCVPSVQVYGSDPSKSSPFASVQPVGFYTDLDPLNTPIRFAIKDSRLSSYIVEVKGGSAAQWRNFYDTDPGWIAFIGKAPESVHVNKVYKLSKRVVACLHLFTMFPI